MIDKALNFLLGEINAFLGVHFGGPENAAVLSSLCNPDGSPPLVIDNKIVLSLVNIEKETSMGSGSFVSRSPSAYSRTNPALHLNLYILISASFSGRPHSYDSALKSLSHSITFLQSKPAFDAQNSPSFPAGFEKLTMEMVSLSMAELSTLWAVLGASYLPSVVYKMRMLTVQDAWIIEPIPNITEAAPTIGNTP